MDQDPNSQLALIKIITPGIYSTDHQNFVVEGNLMAWAEAAYNPRYLNKTFSIIKVKNLETGKIKQLSHRSKYFSPAPSLDVSKIAVIEYDEYENCSIKIIDIGTEQVLKSYNHKKEFLAQPRWISNEEIVLVVTNYEGNQLVKINTINGGSPVRRRCGRDPSRWRPGRRTAQESPRVVPRWSPPPD